VVFYWKRRKRHGGKEGGRHHFGLDSSLKGIMGRSSFKKEGGWERARGEGLANGRTCQYASLSPDEKACLKNREIKTSEKEEKKGK